MFNFSAKLRAVITSVFNRNYKLLSVIDNKKKNGCKIIRVKFKYRSNVSIKRL